MATLTFTGHVIHYNKQNMHMVQMAESSIQLPGTLATYESGEGVRETKLAGLLLSVVPLPYLLPTQFYLQYFTLHTNDQELG
jgi:hypothetical protein